MEINKQLKSFLNLYQTAGWVILLMLGGLILQGLIWVAVSAYSDAPEAYEKVMDYLVLSSSVRDFIYKPWTLVTYVFFWGDVGNQLLRILFDGAFIWLFLRIYQQMLGDVSAKRILFLAVPTIALFTLTVCAIIPVIGEAMVPMDISGISPIMVFMAIACASLVPDYPIQLFLLGRVKIKWVVIVLVLLELAAVAFTPMGIAVAIAALLGFLHIQLLKKGTDVTVLVWSYYQDKTTRTSVNPTRMKVKYGGKFTTSSEESRKKRHQGKDKKIPQELIDSLLDKISEKGYDSLSREEKELLFKASSQKEDDK